MNKLYFIYLLKKNELPILLKTYQNYIKVSIANKIII